MVEASSGATTPKPQPAQYLKIPTPAPNGAEPSADELKRAYAGKAPAVPAPASTTPAKTTSDVLVEASETLARALDARIAWHERELHRLRAARAPFARQNAADAAPSNSEADAEFLVRVMRQLNQENGES